MSELPNTPLQTEIDREGGLYDQALDAKAKWEKDEQDEAYATYVDNIQTTQAREQHEVYVAATHNPEMTQAQEAAEYNHHKQELRKAKRKQAVSDLGAAAMWIPGIDVIGSMVKEEFTTHKLNKARKQRYQQRYGASGVGATIRNKYELDKKKHNEQNRIIKDLSELVEQYEQDKKAT